MRLYTGSLLFYTLLKTKESTLILISSLVLPPLVTYYSLFFKLYIKLFVERNKTVCPGPISFLEAVISLSVNTHHFKSFSLYDPGRNVTDAK